MRILFTTFAARTHFSLQSPLAWSLAQAGHEVCVASQPNLVPTITASGLLAASVGSPLDIGEIIKEGGSRSPFNVADMNDQRADGSNIVGALSIYGPIISGSLADDRMLIDLFDFARVWRPDLIVWDALTYPGSLCAQALGIPSVRVLFAMDHFSRLRDNFLALKSCRTDPLTTWLQRRLRRLNLPAASEEELDTLALGTVTVDPLPSPFSVSPNHPRWEVQLPNAFGAEVEKWHLAPPRNERPRICVTVGLSSREFGLTPPPLAKILEGLGQLDVEVIVTLTPDQQKELPPLPANVRPVPVVPLDALLQTCDVVVHHFGTGTLTAALRQGVPQVHVAGPMDLWGETVLADRLSEHGAARSISYSDITPELVGDTIRGLLADETAHARAKELKRVYLQRETPHDLVRCFEALV